MIKDVPLNIYLQKICALTNNKHQITQILFYLATIYFKLNRLK